MANLCRNLEMKAACPDLVAARLAVRNLGAPLTGIEVQTDTFFRVSHGRLKLREIEGSTAVLIWYDRPDRFGPRPSSYQLASVDDAVKTKDLLESALGIRGEVRKRREFHQWFNVRIHLDEVASLGNFLEFKAVLSAAEDEATAQKRLDHLCQVLAVGPLDHLAVAYADLLGLT